MHIPILYFYICDKFANVPPCTLLRKVSNSQRSFWGGVANIRNEQRLLNFLFVYPWKKTFLFMSQRCIDVWICLETREELNFAALGNSCFELFSVWYFKPELLNWNNSVESMALNWMNGLNTAETISI